MSSLPSKQFIPTAFPSSLCSSSNAPASSPLGASAHTITFYTPFLTSWSPIHLSDLNSKAPRGGEPSHLALPFPCLEEIPCHEGSCSCLCFSHRALIIVCRLVIGLCPSSIPDCKSGQDRNYGCCAPTGFSESNMVPDTQQALDYLLNEYVLTPCFSKWGRRQRISSENCRAECLDTVLVNWLFSVNSVCYDLCYNCGPDKELVYP